MGFTENQLKAIELRDRNILVSAAAGSGKTSVLVERIIRRITTDKPTVDIDKLLIMTFTNAAAKEMRDRIRQAIEEEIDKNPEDDNLIRQSVLVHNAMITTIHGFCQSIIRENFEKISLDPSFRVADENEKKLLEQDVIETVLEEYYAEGKKEFLDMVEFFASGKNDNKLAELILDIYKFAQSNPDPKAYIDGFLAPYDAKDEEEFEELTFVKNYVKNTIASIKGIINSIDRCIELINHNPGVEPYRKAIENDKSQIESLLKAESYNDISTGIKSINLMSSIGSIRKNNLAAGEEEVKDEVSAIRGKYKDILKNISEDYGNGISASFNTMKNCVPYIRQLISVINSFSDAFAEAKREKNIVDFNDMEHMAIKILSENPDVADYYREKFEEIYIDEYQDSNMTQETLVSLIKRTSPNGNLFMVGDVKQSIYRFRQARSALFVEKYNTYTDVDSGSQKVILNDNFRSRGEVLDSVNEVFEQIMHKEYGGIEYDEDASLKCSATCYAGADEKYKAELVLCQKGDMAKSELQSAYIATRINQLIAEKFPIYDKKLDMMRPVTYKDIVILVRSTRGFATDLKSQLEDNGIPVLITTNTGYFSSAEVQMALAFLSVIDNPLQDVMLATYAKSPAIGFSDEDLAKIRALTFRVNGKKRVTLYDSIRGYAGVAKGCSDNVEEEGQEASKEDIVEEKFSDKEAEITEKCLGILERIDYYRQKATYVPVYALLQEFIDDEYGDFVRCMDRGEQRIANLNALVVKAEEYGKTSFKGLFNFVRYMSLIQKYDIEDGEMNILGEEDDVVRVMTIHKSKGLEFPVCFIAGIEKQRNSNDEKGSVVWDADLGIGLDFIDLEKRTKTKTLYKKIIIDRLKRESIAEEMRVLYVAMTRAREKLIMVGLTEKEGDFEKAKDDIGSVNSYQEMISYAMANKGCLNHTDIYVQDEQDIVFSKVYDELNKEATRDDLLGIIRNESEEYEVPEWLKDIEPDYAYKRDVEVPSKLSVSELKHTDIERKRAEGSEVVEEGKRLFEDTDPEKYIPEFMLEEGQTQSGATFYGTAFHRILELWDYSKLEVSPEDIETFVAEMTKKNMISQQQADAIRPGDIAFFLNTDLGKRIYGANKEGNLFREQPFMFAMSQDEAAYHLGLISSESANGKSAEELSELNSDNSVIIQGIIDAYIIEDDKISIIDYKTDSVRDEKVLINRYQSQLEYYKRALEQITGKDVKELIIYSSKLRKEIKF